MNSVVILYSDFQQLWRDVLIKEQNGFNRDSLHTRLNSYCKTLRFPNIETNMSLPVPVEGNLDTHVKITEYLIRKESTFSIFQVIVPLTETTLVVISNTYINALKGNIFFLCMEIYISMFYVNHDFFIFKPNTTGRSQKQYTLHQERLHSEKHLLSPFKACYWKT